MLNASCTREHADVRNKCSAFSGTSDQFDVMKSPHFNKSTNAFTCMKCATAKMAFNEYTKDNSKQHTNTQQNGAQREKEKERKKKYMNAVMCNKGTVQLEMEIIR